MILPPPARAAHLRTAAVPPRSGCINTAVPRRPIPVVTKSERRVGQDGGGIAWRALPDGRPTSTSAAERPQGDGAASAAAVEFHQLYLHGRAAAASSVGISGFCSDRSVEHPKWCSESTGSEQKWGRTDADQLRPRPRETMICRGPSIEIAAGLGRSDDGVLMRSTD